VVDAGAGVLVREVKVYRSTGTTSKMRERMQFRIKSTGSICHINATRRTRAKVQGTLEIR
jgi:hypothetical protein